MYKYENTSIQIQDLIIFLNQLASSDSQTNFAFVQVLSVGIMSRLKYKYQHKNKCKQKNEHNLYFN